MLDDLDLAWEEQQGPRRRGGPPSRQARQRRRKERKRRRRSFGALFISVLLLAVLGGGVYWGVGKIQEFFGNPDYEASEHDDDRGASSRSTRATAAAEIGQAAARPRAWSRASRPSSRGRRRTRDGTDIQPGTYKLFEQMPAAAAVACPARPGEEPRREQGHHSGGPDRDQDLRQALGGDRHPGRRLRGGGPGPGGARHPGRLVHPHGRQDRRALGRGLPVPGHVPLRPGGDRRRTSSSRWSPSS